MKLDILYGDNYGAKCCVVKSAKSSGQKIRQILRPKNTPNYLDEIKLAVFHKNRRGFFGVKRHVYLYEDDHLL